MRTPFDRPDDDDGLPLDPDLVLITEYLTKELPEDKVAEVKRRLDSDPQFREFAAPLIAAWKIPAWGERHPVPRQVVMKRWDELTKRAGFVHQVEREKELQRKRRKRRRWMTFGFILLATVGTLWAFGGVIAQKFATAVAFETVADSGHGWMQLRNRVEIRIDSNTDIRVLKGSVRGVTWAQLFSGRVQVRHEFVLNEKLEPISGMLITDGRSRITSAGAEYSVWLDYDSTFIEVVDRHRKGADLLAEKVNVQDAHGRYYNVNAGQRAQIVHGDTVLVLPPKPDDLFDTITDSGRAMNVGMGVRVTLTAGSILQRLRRVKGTPGQVYRLRGEGTFVFQSDRTLSDPAARVMMIDTDNGKVGIVGSGAARVRVQGDTTTLEVLRPETVGIAPGVFPVMLTPTEPELMRGEIQMNYRPGERARVVRGHKPEPIK